ncbi:SHOCT-like domain-containing protein [Diplocloster modestus]|uniref:YvlB/LiaX N-terminal domain-containing protein n=1 Tax=Diplocloster modestus TaxID=2850322 RepID=A0ABS6K9F7_9FIRM|nr:hypothetical protein [Diplocloster modestus]MBU9727141.1 hypothetical protein [Diplocloster modestus]
MEEKLRVLKMLEEGKITAEQAAGLLEAIEPEKEEAAYGIEPAANSYDKKMFRIQVDSTDGDKVNIQLPVIAIRKLLNATGKLPIPDESLQGVDLKEITSAVMDCLETQTDGNIVDVSAADGSIVKIYIS